MDATKTNSTNSGEMETKTERIEGTPFLKRWHKNEGWSYGIGNYRISEFYNTEKEMMKNLQAKDWQTIVGLIGSMIDGTLKLHNIIK